VEGVLCIRHTIAACVAGMLLIQSAAAAQTASVPEIRTISPQQGVEILLANLQVGAELRIDMANGHCIEGRLVEASSSEPSSRWRRACVDEERVMTGRWFARVAAVVALSLTADAASAGPRSAGWTTRIQPGSAVRVTIKTNGTFDAIWMGRDGDLGVFERFDPHETISVRLDFVQQVRIRQAPMPPDVAVGGVLGVLVGVWGASALFRLLWAVHKR
jgi:hypothetical protein